MLRFNKNSKNEIPVVDVTVTTRTLIRIVLVVIITLALISFVIKVSNAILLIFIAFFLTLALNSPVAKLSKILPGKRRGSRSIATTASFLIVVILLAAFASYIIPPLIVQTERFISAAPNLINNSNSQHSALGHFIRIHHLQNFVRSLATQITHRFSGYGNKAFSSLSSIANSVFSILAVLVLTFMMLIEGPRWVYVIRDLLVPESISKQVDKVTFDMYDVIKGYVNGQVLLAVIAAVVIAPALFLLHVRYPFALIVIVFLAGLIPMIGHTIGAIIISVVALFHSLTAAIILLLYYLLYMLIENYFLQPRIQANTTNMSPLLVFSSVIIGVNFGGLLGGLVAIPVAACIKVLVLEYLTQKKKLPKNLDSIPSDNME